MFECPENWFLGSTRSLGPRTHSLCAIRGGSADRATYLRHEFRLGNASAIFFEKKLALLKKHSYCPGLNTELRIWVLWPEGRISLRLRLLLPIWCSQSRSFSALPPPKSSSLSSQATKQIKPAAYDIRGTRRINSFGQFLVSVPITVSPV